jgi:hypothetical protein
MDCNEVRGCGNEIKSVREERVWKRAEEWRGLGGGYLRSSTTVPVMSSFW